MSVLEVVVRSFQASQWRAYRDLRLRALTDSPNAFATTLAQAELLSDQEWQRRFVDLSAEHDLPMVAEVDGEFAGMAWIHIDASAPTIAHLFQMWVAPAYRGRGVGRKLLDRAIQWVRSRGAEEVLLGVTCGDSPARRLYTSAGFKPVGRVEPLRPMSKLMVQNMVMAVPPDAA